MNDDFHEASFEVYYVSVAQKLVILEFSPQFFFILTSVTSDTSWGLSMSLSDLYEVSNFSWICQLLYKTLLVWSKNWEALDYVFENGQIPPLPGYLTDQKARVF